MADDEARKQNARIERTRGRRQAQLAITPEAVLAAEIRWMDSDLEELLRILQVTKTGMGDELEWQVARRV